MPSIRIKTTLLTLTAALVTSISLHSPLARANADADTAMAKVKEDTGTDVKKIFGTQCGLCHGDFGMTLGGAAAVPSSQAPNSIARASSSASWKANPA